MCLLKLAHYNLQRFLGNTFKKLSLHLQGNRRALATDEWLRVEGCDNIYALGDCATINQRKVMVIFSSSSSSQCLSISFGL